MSKKKPVIRCVKEKEFPEKKPPSKEEFEFVLTRGGKSARASKRF